MKPLTYKLLVYVLENNGFILTRQRGSHHIYKHAKTGRIVPVPLHGRNKPIPIGTFLSIVSQSGLDKSDFQKK